MSNLQFQKFLDTDGTETTFRSENSKSTSSRRNVPAWLRRRRTRSNDSTKTKKLKKIEIQSFVKSFWWKKLVALKK